MNLPDPGTGVAGLVLAAGASRRLGTPKQIVFWQGQSLVRRAATAMLESRARPGLVILGAHEDAVRAELKGMNVTMVFNPDWREGMASSIRCGLKTLRTTAPGATAVVICTCDQPHVSADLLDELISLDRRSGASIVACRYAGTLGVPALFARSHFAALAGLCGDQGAKGLILAHRDHLESVDFPLGAYDIDQEDDLAPED